MLKQCLCFLVLAAAGCLPALAGDDSLLVRLQDTVAVPGGPVGMAIRTYASRPVGQGQVCLVMRGTVGGADFPLNTLKGVTVYGIADDVTQTVSIIRSKGSADVTIMTEFESPSAGINTVDGPLAALFFDVDADAQIDSEWHIHLDLANTALFDGAGLPIPLELRDGTLSVRDPAAAILIEPEVDQDWASGPISLALQTNEAFAISGGQIAFRYNNRALVGTPHVVYDSRFGFVQFKLDGFPGLAILRIANTNATYNQLPGNIAAIELWRHTSFSDQVDLGMRIDPDLTYLLDANGQVLPMVIENNLINRPYLQSAPDNHEAGK